MSDFIDAESTNGDGEDDWLHPLASDEAEKEDHESVRSDDTFGRCPDPSTSSPQRVGLDSDPIPRSAPSGVDVEVDQGESTRVKPLSQDNDQEYAAELTALSDGPSGRIGLDSDLTSDPSLAEDSVSFGPLWMTSSSTTSAEMRPSSPTDAHIAHTGIESVRATIFSPESMVPFDDDNDDLLPETEQEQEQEGSDRHHPTRLSGWASASAASGYGSLACWPDRQELHESPRPEDALPWSSGEDMLPGTAGGGRHLRDRHAHLPAMLSPSCDGVLSSSPPQLAVSWGGEWSAWDVGM